MQHTPAAVRMAVAIVVTFALGGCGLWGGDDEIAADPTSEVTSTSTDERDTTTDSPASSTTLPPFRDRGFPAELDRIESLDMGGAWRVLCLGRTLRLVGDNEVEELQTKLLGEHDVTADEVADAIDHSCDDAGGEPDVAIRIFMEDLEIDDADMSAIVDKNCDQFAEENNFSAQGITYDAILRLATGASDEELSMSIVEACGAERFTG